MEITTIKKIFVGIFIILIILCAITQPSTWTYVFILTGLFLFLPFYFYKGVSIGTPVSPKYFLLWTLPYFFLCTLVMHMDQFFKNQYDHYEFNKLKEEKKLNYISNFEDFKILKRQKNCQPIPRLRPHINNQKLLYESERNARKKLHEKLQKICEIELQFFDNKKLLSLSNQEKIFCQRIINNKENLKNESLVFLFEYAIGLSHILNKQDQIEYLFSIINMIKNGKIISLKHYF